MPANNKAICVRELFKGYGAGPVVKGISLTVEQGEIFGLLGTNGAGKTTTLECIEGLRRYESGEIELNGKTGIQLQNSSLADEIRAMEAIQLFGKWNRSKPDTETMRALGVDEFAQKRYQELSTGQKRRLHLILALTGNPDILFLDEPTAGLDVEGRAALHSQIRALKKRGKTILLASHDMAEVEELCDRIAILKNGKIAFEGPANELTRQMSGKSRIFLRTSAPLRADGLLASRFEGIKQGYACFSSENAGDALLELLTRAKAEEALVLDIKLERASLEESFLTLAKEEAAV